MNYLQLINAVLKRLREDEVSDVNQSEYSKLIGMFINETKREVEDAWNWVQLRTTIQVTCVADTFRYTLTGAGDRYRILQVVNDSADHEMVPADYKWMNLQFTTNVNTPNGHPYRYDINGSTDGDPNVDFFPIPDTEDVINFNLVLPQDDLSDGADILTVPSWPVILGAYSKALSERGEDGGQQYAEVLNQYWMALGDAVAIDSANVPYEMVWKQV